jgi:uncharacterized protein (DUF362 family)
MKERLPGRKMSKMNRREFCSRVTRGTVGALSALSFCRLPLPLPVSAASATDLGAVKGNAAAAVRRAVELVGGMGRFVRSGQKVVVKPNIGWDRTPEQAANTSPEVVTAVVRMALEAGAKEVLVFDRTCNDQRLCYRRSGIGPAVEAIDEGEVKIFHPDRRKYVEVAIPGGKALSKWLFYEEAVEADVFINVPVAKHHALSGLTLGMKNVMGVIGGNRGQIHSGFDDKIVDLNLARPSHLTVLDATRILTAHGPQGGRLEDVSKPGVVVAGPDIVAVDAYATRFFDRKPEGIAHIVRAAERGLGTMDLSTLTIGEESV